jgi:hypothetical protein
LQPATPSAEDVQANQKDRPSALAKGLFCLPNGSGSSGLRGRLLEGRLRYLPHRIHSLFTISNTRVPSHKELDTRVSCTRGALASRTADLFDCPDKRQCRQAPWWSQTGSNRRPHACKARALPTELWPHCWVGLKRRRRRPSPWLSRYRARRPVGLASALAGLGCVSS